MNNNDTMVNGFNAGALNWEQQRRLLNEEIAAKPRNIAYDAKDYKFAEIPLNLQDYEPLEESNVETAEMQDSSITETKLHNSLVKIETTDLSATMILDDAGTWFKKMTGPLAQIKEEKRVLQANLDQKKNDIGVLEAKNANLQKIIDQMKLEAEKTARKHAKIVERIAGEKAELIEKNTYLENEIKFRDQPKRSPIETKEVLEGIYSNFKDLKVNFEECIANIDNLSLEEKTMFNKKFITVLKDEKMKLNAIAKEVEILFTAQAYKSEDKAVIELRNKMFTLWNEAKMLGYELKLSSIQLDKTIQLPKVEKELESVKALFEGEEGFKTLRMGEKYYPALWYSWNPLDLGYRVNTQKLGIFEMFLESVRNKFDELNKIAFKQEAALIKFHKDFQLVKHTDSARRLGASDFSQASANEIKSNEIHDKYQANLKVIYEKSVAAWKALSQAQNDIHEKLAVLEAAKVSPTLGLPSKGTLDDAKILKYQPAAIIV